MRSKLVELSLHWDNIKFINKVIPVSGVYGEKYKEE